MFHEVEANGKMVARFMLLLVQNAPDDIRPERWSLAIADWANKFEVIYCTGITAAQADWLHTRNFNVDGYFSRETDGWEDALALVKIYEQGRMDASRRDFEKHYEQHFRNPFRTP